MAATKYTYSISTDFPNQKVATDRLLKEIRESAIVTVVDYINTDGDNCDIWFRDALSGGDETILDGLVAAHSGEYLYATWPVQLYDGDGHPILVQQDGSYYRVAQYSKVQNSSGVTVNPATQETLALIKDTDGIKKITDSLPSGSNTLGKIDQGAAGAAAWKTDGSSVTQPISAVSLPLPAGAATETTLAAIKNTDGVKKITDALPTGDNTVGRVKLTDGTNVVDVLNDAGVKRLRVDAKVSTATTVNLATDYLRTAGAAYQMKVDGSVTPVVFYYAADATKDITILELRIVFSAESFNWSGGGFGKAASGALTNGVLLELVINSGTTITLSTFKVNEDFLRTYGEIPAISQSGANDVLVTSFKSSGGLILKAGTADRVRVTVRDNLANAALGVNSLTATFFGEKAV